MNVKNSQQLVLEDTKISLKFKIALLWTSFMLLYIYVDYFHLYMPGFLSDLLIGKVFLFDVTQIFVLVGLVSVSIPALMISLSVVLPAYLSRWTNIVVAAFYIPYSLFNLSGESWIHMYYAAAVEVAILLLIIVYSWRWPRVGLGKIL